MCSTVGQSELPVEEMQNATRVGSDFLMCGRYRLSRWKQVVEEYVEEYFESTPMEHDWRQRIGTSKQPYGFEVHEGELFTFAGICDRSKNASDNAVET